MSTPFELMTHGNLFGAFIQAFVDAGISQGMLFSIFFILAGGLIYIKTKNFAVVALAMMFGSVSLINEIAPVTSTYVSWIIIIALVGVMYIFFKGSK